MSLRILAIYRHYWPDTTTYAANLRQILERFAADGHEVVAFAAQPSYGDSLSIRQPARECIGGVDVHRVTLLRERRVWPFRRMVNYLLFAVYALWFALRRKQYDIVIGCTTPQIIMGATLWAIHKLTGAPFIYHVQDLHPESAVLAGKIQSGVIQNILTAIDRQTCRNAWRVVVLSGDMEKAVRERSDSLDNINVINNFRIAVGGSNPHGEQLRDDGKKENFRLLFAGNLGAFQGVERIIEVARLLRHCKEFQFYFIGGGERHPQLIDLASGLIGTTVHFLGPQPYETALWWMSQADLGIISLTRGVYRVAYPSKLMAYLATGLPILAMVESCSELATTIRDNRIGYVPADTRPKSVVNTILAARSEAIAGNLPSRLHVQHVGDELFHPERTLNRWAQLMHTLEAEKATNPVSVLPPVHSFVK